MTKAIEEDLGKCDCISSLGLTAHGADNGAILFPNSEGKNIYDQQANITVRFLGLRSSKNAMCSDCTIQLRMCNAGGYYGTIPGTRASDPMSYRVGRYTDGAEMARESGCKVVTCIDLNRQGRLYEFIGDKFTGHHHYTTTGDECVGPQKTFHPDGTVTYTDSIVLPETSRNPYPYSGTK